MLFDFNAIAGNRLWQKLRQHGPLLLGTALIIAAAWQAAVLTWSMFESATAEPVLPPPTGIASAAGTSAGRSSMASVAAMHLFGTAEAAAETLAAAAADAPETRLNLKLRGILAADPPEYSRAIISSGNDDKVYAVGAAVPGGASVEAVLADRVVLRRDGRLETLRLPREMADGGVTYEEPAAREEESDNRADFTEIRQEIVEDPSRLSELLRYSPVLEDGQIRGYRIYPARDRAKFAQLGLQPGDIVTAINGTPLSDPGRAMEMMNTLTDASNIILTVERNGAPQDITLSPSQ
ncbi:MAG TPA: type II secretion system protein GspC [Gammaproteobacteria bacterium]